MSMNYPYPDTASIDMDKVLDEIQSLAEEWVGYEHDVREHLVWFALLHNPGSGIVFVTGSLYLPEVDDYEDIDYCLGMFEDVQRKYRNTTTN